MIKMKKIIFLFTALLFVSFFTNAQESEDEKIKALKIAFITEHVNLTTYEAQKFWPVYNKYDELLHQLERVEKFKIRTKITKAGGLDKLSESEAKTLIIEDTALNKQIFITKLEYDKELTNVFSYKKILKLKDAEREFVRNLMKKYRKGKPTSTKN